MDVEGSRCAADLSILAKRRAMADAARNRTGRDSERRQASRRAHSNHRVVEHNALAALAPLPLPEDCEKGAGPPAVVVEGLFLSGLGVDLASGEADGSNVPFGKVVKPASEGQHQQQKQPRDRPSVAAAETDV